MLMKLLLLVAVGTVVYFMFFKKKENVPPTSDTSSDEAMIPCAQCGTYVQAKEAFMRDGKYYCSRECMEG
ncbi:MAG: PP0621 family protein [Sulfuricurvum sp.]